LHALIIEQDAFTVIMIEDILRQVGFTSFDVACSGAEASAAAGHRCPDLITSALRLGSEFAIDAVEALCADNEIAVVYVTSTSWQVRERVAGAVVVQKPFRPIDLETAVQVATARL